MAVERGMARSVLYHKLPGFIENLDEVIRLVDEAGCTRLYGDLVFLHPRLKRLRRVIKERRQRPNHCRHCGAKSCYCCNECGMFVAAHDEGCSHYEEDQ